MISAVTPSGARLSIHPGEWYFGNEYENLYTILGSCVALSVWHPTLKIGGLCHYLLPAQPSHLTSGNKADSQKNSEEVAGRYGNSVLPLLKQAMQRYALLNEYQLGLFGGCDTLSNYGIGKQNVLYAQLWLQNENLVVAQTDVGGTNSRSLLLDMQTGTLNIKHYALQTGNPQMTKP